MPKGNSGRKRNTGAYKEFDDVPVSSLSYNRDDTDTAQWFEENSNLLEIYNKLTDNDKSALREYTRAVFMDGQLYNGFSKMNELEQNICRTLDGIFDKSIIKSNVKVSRLSTAEFLFGKGNKTGTIKDFEAMKNKVITAKSFLSSSAAKQGLRIGGSIKEVEYKIHIPAGSKGVGMYIGGKLKSIAPIARIQREFIINRDTKWRIGDTKYNELRKVYETDIFFVGCRTHDYS